MSDLFVIRCSQAIFSDAEVEILEDHGKRLERLGDGRQRPVSPAGRRFVEVVKGRLEPKTIYERTWLKYLRRLEWEPDPANRAIMGPLRMAHDDREDWKRMSASTRGEMVKRARGLDG